MTPWPELAQHTWARCKIEERLPHLNVKDGQFWLAFENDWLNFQISSGLLSCPWLSKIAL